MESAAAYPADTAALRNSSGLAIFDVRKNFTKRTTATNARSQAASRGTHCFAGIFAMADGSNPASVSETDSLGFPVSFFRRRLRNNSGIPERKKPATAIAVPKTRRTTRSRVWGERVVVLSSGASGSYFTVMTSPTKRGDDSCPDLPV